MPHGKRHRGSTKKSKAVDNTYSRPCICMEAAGQEFPSQVSAAAQQGDPALTEMWGAHTAPWRVEGEELRAAASAVLLWLWRSALSNSSSSQDRNSHKKFERGSCLFTSCTRWANFLWASLTSLHRSPKATPGLALRPPKHPLSFLRCVYNQIPSFPLGFLWMLMHSPLFL